VKRRGFIITSILGSIAAFLGIRPKGRWNEIMVLDSEYERIRGRHVHRVVYDDDFELVEGPGKRDLWYGTIGGQDA